MLAASWFVCRWCVHRLDVGRTVPTRSSMGLFAFLVLMSVEVRLGAVFGRSLADQLAALKFSRSDRPRRSGDLCHVPGNSGLAAVTTFGKGRGFPNSGAIQYRWRSTNSVADIPSVRDSKQPEPTHLGLGQELSGVRVPQRKIIHLAEFFEAIWGVDGHEHVQIPGSR